MNFLMLTLTLLVSTLVQAGPGAGGGGGKNEADFKSHLYKITDELIEKRKMAVVGDKDVNVDLKLFLASVKIAKVDIVKATPMWDAKPKDAIYDPKLDRILVGPSFFENPLDTAMYPKAFGKPRKDILQDIIAVHEILRYMYGHELLTTNDDDYYLSIKIVSEVIDPANDAFYDAAKTIPRLAYEVSSDRENTYYPDTGMRDVVRSRDLTGPLPHNGYLLAAGDRAKMRALKVCHTLHGADYGVKNYKMEVIKKGDAKFQFVAFRTHICTPDESVADNTSVSFQTAVERSPGVKADSFVMIDKYYVFTELQCTNVKSQMVIVSDAFRTCDNEEAVATPAQSPATTSQPQSSSVNTTVSAPVSIPVSNPIRYIRCRALSAGGDVIYGDYESASQDVNASAEQAYRNFLGTRCGGPLGGQCARPIKCDGYDSNLRNLGQVLEK